MSSRAERSHVSPYLESILQGLTRTIVDGTLATVSWKPLGPSCRRCNPPFSSPGFYIRLLKRTEVHPPRERNITPKAISLRVPPLDARDVRSGEANEKQRFLSSNLFLYKVES